jgi:septal ring factor EnvC (AmiA/AmiB activator)
MKDFLTALKIFITGLAIGGLVVWGLTNHMVENAVEEAENKFENFLSEEKEKLQSKLDDSQRLKDELEKSLSETQTKVDSLNTAILNRNNELNKIKKEYDKKLSSIDNMSHNELSDFFANRYSE